MTRKQRRLTMIGGSLAVLAIAAALEARQGVANDADRLRQLNEGLKNLGLDG